MNQVPAFLQKLQGRNLGQSAMQGIGGRGGQIPAHVSIKGNRFTLVDAAGQERPHPMLHLDVVIVDANPGLSKVYYEGAFDPSATEYLPPTCYSENGIEPSDNSTEKQSPLCAICDWNAWGSKQSQVSGKNTKACTDGKKIAVMPVGMGIPFMLRIPPASLKNFKSFVQVIDGNGAEVQIVVTRIEFQGQGILSFTPVGWIDEQTVDLVGSLDETGLAELVGKVEGAPQIAAQPRPQIDAPKPMPTPAPVPQPTPRPVPQQTEAPRRGRPPKAEPKPAAPAQQGNGMFGQAHANQATQQGGAPVQGNGMFSQGRQPLPQAEMQDGEDLGQKTQFGMVDAAPVTDANLDALLDEHLNLPT